MSVKPMKWVVEFSVDPLWVADGFEPTAEDFRQALLRTLLRDAYPDEVTARVLKAPCQAAIAAEQGFGSAK